jgi:hypothetical protein
VEELGDPGDPAAMIDGPVRRIRNPYQLELKVDEPVVLFERENFQGWRHVQKGTADHLPDRVNDGASSLLVTRTGWVTFYSKSAKRGSELWVRGPCMIPDLKAAPKNNWPGANGNWNDEIRSVEFNDRKPSGRGTYVNSDDPKEDGLNGIRWGLPTPLGEGSKGASYVIYGHSLEDNGELLSFYIYNMGCTNDWGAVESEKVVDKIKTGITCRGRDVYVIFYNK